MKTSRLRPSIVFFCVVCLCQAVAHVGGASAQDTLALFREAVRLQAQSVVERAEEQYEAALATARRALDLQTRSGQTATLHMHWSGIGANLLSLGRVDEAVDAFRRARLDLEADRTPRGAAARRDLVRAELARHDRNAAVRELDAFATAAIQAPPVFQARAKLAASDLAIADGHPEAALALIREAQTLLVGDTDAAVATVQLEAVGQMLMLVLEAAATLPYDEALALAARLDRPDSGLPVQVAPFARMAARARRRLAGEIDLVLADDIAALERSRAARDSGAELDALESLAATYRAAGNLTQQMIALEQGIETAGILAKERPDATTLVQVRSVQLLVALGDAAIAAADSKKARAAFTRASDLVARMDARTGDPAIRDAVAALRLGQARVLELDDDREGARALLRDAIASARSGSAGSRTTASWQLARLEAAAPGRAAETLAQYEHAIASAAAGRDRVVEATLRLELAGVLARLPKTTLTGAHDRAAAELLQVDAANVRLGLSDARWRVELIRGILAEASGNAAIARVAYESAVDRLDAIRAGLSEEEQRRSFVSQDAVRELYERLVGVLMAQGEHARAWAFLERGRARTFLETLQGRRFGAPGSDPADARLRSLEQEIVGLRVALAPENAGVLRSAGRDAAQLGHELLQLERRFVQLRQQVALVNSRSGQALALDVLGLPETSRLLPHGVTLIEYGFVPGGLTAFVVSSSGARARRWNLDQDALRDNVRALRRQLARPGDLTELNDGIAAVSTAVLAPVLGDLPPGTERLIIIPAGALSYLPFELLRLADGRYVVEQFAVSYLPSATTLRVLEGARPAKADLFLGAIGEESVEGWAPLPGTLVETDRIATMRPLAARASGAAFTHEVARSALLTHEQVHFATHGLLDEHAPLFSALLVGPAKGQPTRLSLYEIPSMALKAKLVVLSACETGLGPLMGGDEITSLTRTFLLAGANTVVSSLWEVSDDSTALLMTEFYRHLGDGHSPAAALRLASLDVRKVFPHPFYWAPFIVTGAA